MSIQSLTNLLPNGKYKKESLSVPVWSCPSPCPMPNHVSCLDCHYREPLQYDLFGGAK